MAKITYIDIAGTARTVKLKLSKTDRMRLRGRTSQVVLALAGTTAKATLVVR